MFFWNCKKEKKPPTANSTIATQIDSINFEGLNRTKQDILKELVKPILNSTNLQDTYDNIDFVLKRFNELGLFRNVRVMIDEWPKNKELDDGPMNLDVTFDVEETKRYAGSIYFSGNHNEVCGNLEMRSPNLFGRGEQIRCQIEHTPRYYGSWSANFTKPLIKTPWQSLRSNIDITLLQLSKHCYWSGFQEVDRNLIFGLNIQPSQSHSHAFQYETSWRYLSGLANYKPDFEIIEQFDHSLKTSISHIYTYDTRDNAALASSGTLFRLTNEYAGFQKHGVSFRKHEAEIQHNLLSFLQLSLKGGTMNNFSNVKVCDKFFLGGPLNLRGFEMFGIGLHGEKGNSSLGQTKYWIGALHIHYPLPFKNMFDQYLRLHGFLNAGSLSDDIRQLTKNIRCSYGLGLIFAFGQNIRLELNYSMPLLNQINDKLHKGIQFGIGMNYI